MVSRSGHPNRRRETGCHPIWARLESKLYANGLNHNEGGIQAKQFRRILRSGYNKSA
jgi:hypothetical protein